MKILINNEYFKVNRIYYFNTEYTLKGDPIIKYVIEAEDPDITRKWFNPTKFIMSYKDVLKEIVLEGGEQLNISEDENISR